MPTTRTRLWLVAVLAVAVAIAIGVTLALSGRGGEPARAAATAATTAPAPTTAAPAPTTTAAAPAAGPSCAPAAILPVLQGTLDKDSGSAAPKLTGVTVERCAHGFANVTATPARADTDVLLAFLKAEGGNWQVIDYGSDVGCTSDAAPGVRAACRGLGYPVTD